MTHEWLSFYLPNTYVCWIWRYLMEYHKLTQLSSSRVRQFGKGSVHMNTLWRTTIYEKKEWLLETYRPLGFSVLNGPMRKVEERGQIECKLLKSRFLVHYVGPTALKVRTCIVTSIDCIVYEDLLTQYVKIYVYMDWPSIADLDSGKTAFNRRLNMFRPNAEMLKLYELVQRKQGSTIGHWALVVGRQVRDLIAQPKYVYGLGLVIMQRVGPTLWLGSQ